MAIKVGSANVTDIKVGGTNVDKVMVGSTVLWERDSTTKGGVWRGTMTCGSRVENVVMQNRSSLYSWHVTGSIYARLYNPRNGSWEFGLNNTGEEHITIKFITKDKGAKSFSFDYTEKISLTEINTWSIDINWSAS